MLKIPFYRPSVGPEEAASVVETLKSGWLTTGARTKQFEAEFGNYLTQKHSVAVNSCTAALHLALEAIGVQPGDGVIVPTMTFAATAEVVRYLGGTPILVDCRESDFNMDIADAERRLRLARSKGQNVVAIMPVHYAGQIGDVEGYSRLAAQHGLKIIEDAAHCCPASYRLPASALPGGKMSEPGPWLPVGTSADISCFSFYANKCITTGEGGMACTANEAYADRMRIMSLHGISRDAWKRFMSEGSWYYEIIAPGYKYNFTDVAASIGIEQLKKSDSFHRKRQELAALYQKLLGDVEELTLPKAQPDRIHSWHLFVIRLNLDRLSINRGDFITQLSKAGIGTSVHYTPLHLHPYYREKFHYQPSDLPTMNRIYPEIITLPLYPELRPEDVEYICKTVKELIAANRA